MPVWDAPGDDAGDSPRQSYNFAPGSYGMVYRADVPDRGARPGGSSDGAEPSEVSKDAEPSESLEAAVAPSETEQESEDHDWVDVGAETEHGTPKKTKKTPSTKDISSPTKPTHDGSRYKLQAMRWGLIPFWTKRNPGYASVMKTINCRSDSLSRSGGMWTTMKMRKRCVVVADGFYEWLKVGPKEKIPHYIKRKDGGPMLFAGLWDCVTYEGRCDSLLSSTFRFTKGERVGLTCV